MTGGLVANAIEKPTGHAGEGHATCSDCGSETSGNFCANCGQPTHVHRTLLHLGEELLHGVMHFDARIWRTLPLLWANPGKLTREWVEGKRTRYVSPLAIFLFTLFVMFFALSFVPQHEGSAMLADDIAEQREDLIQAEQNLAQTRLELTSDSTGVGQMAVKAAEALVIDRREELEDMERQVREGRSDGLKPGSWQASLKDMADDNEGTQGGTTKLKVMGEEVKADEHGFGPR